MPPDCPHIIRANEGTQRSQRCSRPSSGPGRMYYLLTAGVQQLLRQVRRSRLQQSPSVQFLRAVAPHRLGGPLKIWATKRTRLGRWGGPSPGTARRRWTPQRPLDQPGRDGDGGAAEVSQRRGQSICTGPTQLTSSDSSSSSGCRAARTAVFACCVVDVSVAPGHLLAARLLTQRRGTLRKQIRQAGFLAATREAAGDGSHIMGPPWMTSACSRCAGWRAARW